MDLERLGPYRVERELGAGAMGTVYAAVAQRATAGLAAGTEVAIKVVRKHLLESADAAVRFRREVEIGAAVRHRNVVRTYDGGREGELQYLVMELVHGQTLAELREELGVVPEELCRHIGREVGRGLGAIHAVGAVHRDVKPENVLITPEHVVKIMDLGVARLVDESVRLSQTGAFVGSLQYAAPECFTGDFGAPDHRVDLHALGLLLYELSTGDAPYAAPDLHATIRRVLEDQPRRLGELNPQVSPFFEDVVHTLLVKEPRGRFASAGDLVQVLEQGEDGAWWHSRARALRVETRRPLRRIRIPRETAIFGRDAEIALLQERFDLAAAGNGQVVLIEGEAGIGKSRLVDELVLRLERSGVDVNFLFGDYPPGGAATASGAFSTAYREQFGDDGSATYLADTPLLVPAFDALLRGDGTPQDAQPLTRGSLQTCFVNATRELAAERPTVILIDDLHFAPDEGRALFAALATSIPGRRVLLIGTTRRGLSRDWVASVTRLRHTTHLELSRLGPKDLYELLYDALRSERLADRLAGQIGLKSDGNPFFVFEILRGLREGQLITRTKDGTWVSTARIDDIEIPSSVVDLIEARVSDLADDERELLEVAACCGFEFDGTLVAAAVGEQRIPTYRRLARLEKRHRLVRASGRLHVFDHHQVRDVLYAGLPEVLREEYHAAIAEALVARAGDAAGHPDQLDGALCVDLCEHFFKGGRPDQAYAYLTRAAGHLETSHLHDRAVALAERALGDPGLVDDEHRVRLLRNKASWLANYGRVEDQRAALEEALALAEARGNVAERYHCERALGNHLATRADWEGAERHLRASVELARQLGDRRFEGVALNALATMLYHQSRHDEARPLYEEHLRIAVDTGDTKQEARAACNLGLVHLAQARYPEARKLFKRTYDLAARIGDRYGQAVATSNLGGIAYYLGRWEEARDSFERDVAMAREMGDRRSEVGALGNLGIAVRALGHLADAERYQDRQHGLAEELGEAVSAASACGKLGTLMLVYGDLDAAERWIERCRTEGAALGDRGTIAWGDRRAAELCAARGRFAEAADLFGRATELAREVGVRSLVAEALSEGAAASMLCNRREAALTMLHESVEIARQIGSPEWSVNGACRLARLTGDGTDAALAAFDEHREQLGVVARARVHFLVWRMTRDDAHLAAARALVEYLCDHAPESRRDSIRSGFPLAAAVLAGDPAAPIE